MPVHEIMAKADWKSAETFHKYYNKPVIQENSEAPAVELAPTLLLPCLLCTWSGLLYFLFVAVHAIVTYICKKTKQNKNYVLYCVYYWGCFCRRLRLHMALGYLYIPLGLLYGRINTLKSHGMSAFWSCDRIEKLNETYC